MVEADPVEMETSAAMRNLQRIWSGEGEDDDRRIQWNGRKQSEFNESISDLIFPSNIIRPCLTP